MEKQFQMKQNPKSFIKNNRRQIRQIQINKKKQTIYLKTRRGCRSETKQLNINIKTLTKNYLFESLKTRELGNQQRPIIQEYSETKANFQSRDNLFKGNDQAHNNIKMACLRYYQSINLIKNVFSSDRMHYNNKIIIIKFLQQIYNGVNNPSLQWKESSIRRCLSGF